MMYEDFVESTREAGGFATVEDSYRAIAATLASLAAGLDYRVARRVARELPPPIDGLLDAGDEEGTLDLDALCARVSRREGVSTGFAREHVGVVLAALGANLQRETLAALRKALPPEVAELLEPRAEPRAVELSPHGRGRTLATGKPGSRRPLSEARPDVTHSESVAAAENPHSDRKISSAGSPPPRRRR